MTRFKITRMNKKSHAALEIRKILNGLSTTEAIEVIEKIGKQLRQAHSIQINKEVKDFSMKKGIRKDIDYTPILPKDADKRKD